MLGVSEDSDDDDIKACCYKITSTVDWKPSTTAARTVMGYFKATAYPVLKADAATYRCMTDDMTKKMINASKNETDTSTTWTFEAVEGLKYQAVCSGASGLMSSVVTGVFAVYAATF